MPQDAGQNTAQAPSEDLGISVAFNSLHSSFSDAQGASREKLQLLKRRSEASRKISGPAGQVMVEKDNRPRPIGQLLNLDSHAAKASLQAGSQIMSARSMPVYLDITELYNSSSGDDMSTKLSLRSSLSTGGEKRNSEEGSSELLSACEDPAQTMQSALKALKRANASQRIDLEWRAQNQALQDFRRLLKHHSSLVQEQVSAIVLATAPAVEALRSQTARAALITLQELLQRLGTGADACTEAIVAAAAKRAGEVGRAGRESSLSAEADALLAAAVSRLSALKVASALLANLSNRNQHTRAKMAHHLCMCMANAPAQFVASGTTALQAKVFAAAVACLEDGSPDARACGRKLLRLLRDQIIQAAAFKDLSDKRPKGQQLKIQKVISRQDSFSVDAVSRQTSASLAALLLSKDSNSRHNNGSLTRVMTSKRSSQSSLQPDADIENKVLVRSAMRRPSTASPILSRSRTTLPAEAK